jgi:hypothetical protein
MFPIRFLAKPYKHPDAHETWEKYLAHGESDPRYYALMNIVHQRPEFFGQDWYLATKEASDAAIMAHFHARLAGKTEKEATDAASKVYYSYQNGKA